MPTESEQKARLEQQAAHSHVPTCAICFSALMDKDKDLLQEMEVVMWKECGHVYHDRCIQDMFGKLPRTRRIPLAEDEDYDEDEHYPTEYKGCPECPICRRKGGKCLQGRCHWSGQCDPIQKIFLSGSDVNDHEPYPVKIYIDGEVQDVLDLAAVARDIGEDVDKLADLVAEDEHWERVAERGELKVSVTDVTQAYKQLKDLMRKLQREKATAMLPAQMALLNARLEKYSEMTYHAEQFERLNERLAESDEAQQAAERRFATNITQMSAAHAKELSRRYEMYARQESRIQAQLDSKSDALKESQADVAFWKQKFSDVEGKNKKLEELNAGLVQKVADIVKEQEKQREVDVKEEVDRRMRVERRKMADLKRTCMEAFEQITSESEES